MALVLLVSYLQKHSSLSPHKKFSILRGIFNNGNGKTMVTMSTPFTIDNDFMIVPNILQKLM